MLDARVVRAFVGTLSSRTFFKASTECGLGLDLFLAL